MESSKESVKPDNTTHAEIKSLSDKFDKVHQRIDESSIRLKEEIDKKFNESKQDRLDDKKEVADTLKSNSNWNRWIAVILISLAYWTIDNFDAKVENMNTSFLKELEEVNVNITETNKNLVTLSEKAAGRDGKIDVINTKLDRLNAVEDLYQKLDEEIQKLKLDMEKRLGKP